MRAEAGKKPGRRALTTGVRGQRGEADFLPQAGGGVGGGGAPKLCARGRATLRLSLHTFRPLPQDVGRDCGHVSSS